MAVDQAIQRLGGVLGLAGQLIQPGQGVLVQAGAGLADGGAGLLITGNVMVDGRAMTGPGGVVLEDASQLDKFQRWARVGRSRGAQFWLQINHPGRQMPANLGQPTLVKP